MCTLLVLRRPAPGIRLALLENRDDPGDPVEGEELCHLPGEGLVGHLDHRSAGLVCGYSTITGLVGGLTNVPGYAGRGDSRGRVLREVLGRCGDLEEARRFLARRLARGGAGAAVYLLSDGERSLRVENFASRVVFRDEPARCSAANHFRILEDGIRLPSSLARAARVRRLLEKPGPLTVGELLAFSGEHGDGLDAICRHAAAGGRTLSASLFVFPDGGEPRVFFAPGPPCLRPHRELTREVTAL